MQPPIQPPPGTEVQPAIPPSDAFAAADAGLNPVSVPSAKNDPPSLDRALKSVGMGPDNAQQDASTPTQAGDQAAAASASTGADIQDSKANQDADDLDGEDPRDKYFKIQGQTPLFNDIKAAPSNQQAGGGQQASPSEGPIVA